MDVELFFTLYKFVDALHQAEEYPIINDPKYEKNATSPGLANPTTLKLLPLRVSQLCMRSALLQRGNALAAMGTGRVSQTGTNHRMQ